MRYFLGPSPVPLHRCYGCGCSGTYLAKKRTVLLISGPTPCTGITRMEWEKPCVSNRIHQGALSPHSLQHQNQHRSPAFTAFTEGCSCFRTVLHSACQTEKLIHPHKREVYFLGCINYTKLSRMSSGVSWHLKSVGSVRKHHMNLTGLTTQITLLF